MAFTGVATIKKVSEGLLRITGLSLAGGAAGTIGLFGGLGAVDLPQDPTQDWDKQGDVGLADAISLLINPVTDVAGYDELVRVVKTGETREAFLATLTNDDDAATPELEIYVRIR